MDEERYVTVYKRNKHCMGIFEDREEATERAYRFTAPELMRLTREISAAMDALYRNANVRLTLTRFAMQTGLLP